MSNDKDLYFACINYCRSFTNLLCVQEDMRRRKYEWGLPVIEPELRFAEDEYKHSLANLCDVVDDFRLQKKKIMDD